MLSRLNTTLRFVTWNIRGVKNTRNLPKKFSHLLGKLKKLQADIAFIQETHVGPKCYKIFEDERGKDWKIFFTVHSSCSKGVAILIRDKVPFEYICHDEDCSGGYIVLFCYLYGELYTLVNVYNHKADRHLLDRLKEYLMETAEGVLVVGGDFNTVLHPRLDREPPSLRNSRLQPILEDFIASLNLRDCWSFLHPADEGFTWCQNVSYSRLDMFFMPLGKIQRLVKIEIHSVDISDHYPVVLKIRVEKQSQHKLPIVASMLKEIKYDPDMRPGKINGAEILNAIKSLSDSEKQRSYQLDVNYYIFNQCPMTEILKIKYNLVLQNKTLLQAFKEANLSRDRPINLEYLIFTRIWDKRLSVFITPSVKRRNNAKLDTLLIMTFEICTAKVRWCFLEQILKNLKKIPCAPLPDFKILDYLLSNVQDSSGKLKLLHPDCPLTNTVLSLSLKQLEDLILKTETQCRTSVCYQRQALFIYVQANRHCRLVTTAEQFEINSGIKIRKTCRKNILL